MTTIGGRVRTAMLSAGIQQKQLAQRVGMTLDALSLCSMTSQASRQLNSPTSLWNSTPMSTSSSQGTRIRIGSRSPRVTPSITRPDREASTASTVTGRFLQTRASPSRRPGTSSLARSRLPTSRRSGDFSPRSSCARSSTTSRRSRSTRCASRGSARPTHPPSRGGPSLLLPESGNWFYENWSLAHELGHLALGRCGRHPRLERIRCEGGRGECVRRRASPARGADAGEGVG